MLGGKLVLIGEEAWCVCVCAGSKESRMEFVLVFYLRNALSWFISAGLIADGCYT